MSLLSLIKIAVYLISTYMCNDYGMTMVAIILAIMISKATLPLHM